LGFSEKFLFQVEAFKELLKIAELLSDFSFSVDGFT
jgi:hypothetical protein